MTHVEILMKALDLAVWEMSEAFKNLPDEDVWKRADPRLLSVGEIAAHVAYWEAQTFFGDDLKSPLFAYQSRYYTANLGDKWTASLTAEGVYAEVKRIHEQCKASIASNPPEIEGPNPHREGWTWGFALEYQAFHISYHVGQMYSVRHLLGHETADN